MYLTRITLTTVATLLGSLVSYQEVRAEDILVNCDISFTNNIGEIDFSPQQIATKQTTKNQGDNLLELDWQKQAVAELSIYESITLNSPEFAKEYALTDCIAIENPQARQIASEEQTKDQAKQSIQDRLVKVMSRLGLLRNQENTEETVITEIDKQSTQNSPIKTAQTNNELENIGLEDIPNANQINQDIQDRYQGLVESDGEKVDLFTNNKLTKELIEAGEQISQDDVNKVNTTGQAEAKNIQEIIKDSNLIDDSEVADRDDDEVLSENPNYTIFLAIFGVGCLVALPVVSILCKNKFSKPKVPDSIIDLHKKTFRKLMNFGNKAARTDDEKFGQQEFKIYFDLRRKVEAGIAGYEEIGQSIKYLEVAIAAQSSYIKLESTELRYRSRKQQAFYEFVTSNITDEIDKDEFRNLAKKKLAEIVPLVASEEGRNALKGYLQEVNKIAEHDLGLRLLALFKKYQLADFTILKRVSDIVERIQAQDVMSEQNLTVIILENYDTLKKLAPIIGISEEDVSPETFTKILQYMGLATRHSKSYSKFQDLLKILRKWQEPFASLELLRSKYPKEEYKLPEEFTAEIPGLETYRKYEKYLKKA